jgi:predicted Zn finger-like uncharacterized protein
MTVVIECESCHSRFRLDKALFKGSKAVRVRCRKCGGPIVVLNPDTPEILPMVEEEPERPGAPAEAPAPPVPPTEPAVPAAAEVSSALEALLEPPPADAPGEPRGPAPEPAAPQADEAPAAHAFGSLFDEMLEPRAPDAPPEPAELAAPQVASTSEEFLEPDEPTEPPGPAEPNAPEIASTSEEFLEPDEPTEPPDLAGPAAPAVASTIEKFLEPLSREAPGERRAAPDWPLPFQNDPPLESPHAAPVSDPMASVLGDLYDSNPQDKPPRPTGFTMDSVPAPNTGPTATRYPAPKRSRERPPYTHPLFLIGVGLWLVLLAGGALLFFGTDGTGGRTGGSLLPSTGTAPGPGTGGRSVYDLRDVTWEILRKTDAGDLFVVRGTVVNAGPGQSDGIRIRATLLGKDNAALGERDAFAGNVIDDTTLRHASQTVLKGVLNKRLGDGERNKEIPPGGSLPFMVVFFDPPANVDSILVKGVDAP